MGKSILSVYIKVGQFFQYKHGSIYKVIAVPLTDNYLTGNKSALKTIELIEVTCQIKEFGFLPRTKSVPFYEFIDNFFPLDSNYIAADMLIDPSKYWSEEYTAIKIPKNRVLLSTIFRKSFIHKNLFYNLPEWEKFYD